MESVPLIAGIFNNKQVVNYWIAETNCSVGDYAIVENQNGFDLVKIVGITYTTKELAKNLSNTRYENMKRVIRVIRENELKRSDDLLTK